MKMRVDSIHLQRYTGLEAKQEQDTTIRREIKGTVSEGKLIKERLPPEKK
jgi:hypothetical protein